MCEYLLMWKYFVEQFNCNSFILDDRIFNFDQSSTVSFISPFMKNKSLESLPKMLNIHLEDFRQKINLIKYALFPLLIEVMCLNSISKS
jgi:hypothetical protein